MDKTENNPKSFSVIHSTQDASVNFIAEGESVGFLEARYVRRTDGYFIVYLSSQTGCAKNCRMCHLTSTGQNKFENASHEDFIRQAQAVLAHYDTKVEAPLVHFNFMSRGEPLDNPVVLEEGSRLFHGLKALADARSLQAKYLISTIMPDTMADRSFTEMFTDPLVYPEIYYSMYSTDPKFRKRWLPRAIAPDRALEKLVQWQVTTGKTPKIHFAFIKGENDSETSVRNLCDMINRSGLKVNFNVVRYNPHSAKYGEESDESVIDRNTQLMFDLLKPEKHRIVPKVGEDVKASCGMFIEK
jgi:adenine C2-methylase RlmN of 23S rRNA A2503 and tRNA A37